MSAHVKDVNLTMYADDHQMYVKGRENETVRCRMKTQGQQALSWYSNNFLLANPDKFQSLNINPQKLYKDKSDKTLSINDLEITVIQSHYSVASVWSLCGQIVRKRRQVQDHV